MGDRGGWLAHARRKFFDRHAVNQSQIARFARVYDIEREERGTKNPEKGGFAPTMGRSENCKQTLPGTG